MANNILLAHGYAHGRERHEISKLDKVIVASAGIHLQSNPDTRLLLACMPLLFWRPPLAELVEAEIRQNNPHLAPETILSNPRARGTIGEIRELQRVAQSNNFHPSQLATMCLSPHQRRVERIIEETFGNEDGKQIEVIDAEKMLPKDSRLLCDTIDSPLYRTFRKSEPKKLAFYNYRLGKAVMEILDESPLKLIFNTIVMARSDN